MAQLLKEKLKTGVPKKTKKKASCNKGKERITKEQNKNKLKNNAYGKGEFNQLLSVDSKDRRHDSL